MKIKVEPNEEELQKLLIFETKRKMTQKNNYLLFQNIQLSITRSGFIFYKTALAFQSH